jgi:hypothetical protein
MDVPAVMPMNRLLHGGYSYRTLRDRLDQMTSGRGHRPRL